jgi:hypothetical protein
MVYTTARLRSCMGQTFPSATSHFPGELITKPPGQCSCGQWPVPEQLWPPEEQERGEGESLDALSPRHV